MNNSATVLIYGEGYSLALTNHDTFNKSEIDLYIFFSKRVTCLDFKKKVDVPF